MNSNLNLRRFASDSLLNFTQIVLTVLLGFAITSVVARTLGAEGKGIYELAVLLPIVLQWVFNLGITTASTYFIAHGDHQLAEAARGNLALSLWLSGFGLLIGVLIATFAGTQVFPGVPQSILLLSLVALPFLYIRGNLNAILQGLQDFRAYSIVESIPSLVTFALLLVLIPGFGVSGVLLAYVIGNAAAALWVIFLLARRTRQSSLFSLHIPRAYLRQMLNYGLKSQMNIIAIYLLLRVDVLLVNLLGGGAASVGIYSVAVLFADRVWLISGFTARVVLPRIASSEGANHDRTALSLLTTRYTFWLSLLIAVGLALLGEWVIVLIYGEPFQPAIHPLLAILPGVILFNFGVLLGTDISGRGRPDITAVHALIAFIINFVANVLLIPRLDYVGAALASSFAYGYYGVIHVIIFSRMNHTHWWQVCLPAHEDLLYAQKGWALLRTRFKRQT
jgi:O-antigen/teichoic acid export membrane protein